MESLLNNIFTMRFDIIVPLSFSLVAVGLAVTLFCMRYFSYRRTRKKFAKMAEQNQEHDPVLLAMRNLDPKFAEVSEDESKDIYHEDYAKSDNAAPAKENVSDSIDHRSDEMQGLTKLGVAAHQMEKQEIHTEQGDINPEIAKITITNDQIRQLAEKTAQMYAYTRKLADDMKRTDRRLDTLASHLAQCDMLKAHKSVALKLKNLSGKKQSDYYAKHKKEIEAYRNATDYFKKVMSGRTDIPVKKWEAEKKKLVSERIALGEKFYSLKDKVKNVETLERNVELLMQDMMKGKSIKSA